MYTNISWKYTNHLMGIEWSIKATMSCFCFAAIEQISPATWDAFLENSEIFFPQFSPVMAIKFLVPWDPTWLQSCESKRIWFFQISDKTTIQNQTQCHGRWLLLPHCLFNAMVPLWLEVTFSIRSHDQHVACGSWGGLYRTPPVLKRGCCSSWRKLDKCSNFWASSVHCGWWVWRWLWWPNLVIDTRPGKHTKNDGTSPCY